jgi:benzoyl-CoA-dihydrodiol lyase
MLNSEILFQTAPEQYKHWRLEIDGAVAKLSMDVQEDETLADGYKLKLNSYDLGVDIELADAVQRLRFEHPEVRVVVVTSLKPRIFCAGANIYMLGSSSHAFKVNFCKFTNETRCAIEDDLDHSGRRYIAALNGTASGGGYELAIACDEIYLVDDGNSAVSLPEVPLLACCLAPVASLGLSIREKCDAIALTCSRPSQRVLKESARRSGD